MSNETSIFIEPFKEYMRLLTDAPSAFLDVLALRNLAVVVGRHPISITPKTLYPNLNIILIGRSGKAKKSTVIELSSVLFPKESQKTSDTYTPEYLMKQMSENPEARNEWDECSTVLRNLARSESYWSGLSEAIMKLYGCSEELSYGTKAEGTIKIEKPYFNLLWATTAKKFIRHIKTENIDDGFLAKTLVVYGEPEDYSRPRRNLRDVPNLNENKEYLKSTLEKIWKVFHTAKFTFELTSDALAYYNEQYFKLEEENLKIVDSDKQELQDAILARYGEYMLKLSCLYEVDGMAEFSNLEGLVIYVTKGNMIKAYNTIINLLNILNTKLLNQLSQAEFSRFLVKFNKLLADGKWHKRSELTPYLNYRNLRELNAFIGEALKEKVIESKFEGATYYRL